MNHTTSKRLLALAAASALAIVVAPGAAADPTDCGGDLFPLMGYASCAYNSTGVDCAVKVTEGFAMCKANPDLLPGDFEPSDLVGSVEDQVQWADGVATMASCDYVGGPACDDPMAWVEGDGMAFVGEVASFPSELASDLMPSACSWTYHKVC